MGMKPVVGLIGMVWAGIALTGCGECCRNNCREKKFDAKPSFPMRSSANPGTIPGGDIPPPTPPGGGTIVPTKAEEKISPSAGLPIGKDYSSGAALPTSGGSPQHVQRLRQHEDLVGGQAPGRVPGASDRVGGGVGNLGVPPVPRTSGLPNSGSDFNSTSGHHGGQPAPLATSTPPDNPPMPPNGQPLPPLAASSREPLPPATQQPTPGNLPPPVVPGAPRGGESSPPPFLR